MSLNITKPISFANNWKNIGTQARTDGYIGNAIVKSLTILNFNTTVAYVHATSDGSTNPSTASDGLPISTDTTNSPSSAITLEGVDINLVWVNTAGTQTIKYQIIEV